MQSWSTPSPATSAAPGRIAGFRVVAVEGQVDAVAVVVGQRHRLAVGVDHVVDVGHDRVLAGAAVERVGRAVAGAEQVVPALAEERVGAAAALQRVAALAAAQRVGRVVAGEVVRPLAAAHRLDVRRDVLLLAGHAVVRDPVERHGHRRRPAVEHGVDAGAADHGVAERVRGERVVAGAAVEQVEAGEAGELVVAALAVGLEPRRRS